MRPRQLLFALCFALAACGRSWGWQTRATKATTAAALVGAALCCHFPCVAAAVSGGNEYSQQVAASYDELDGGVAADLLGLNSLRKEAAGLLVKGGDVLEIAVGTGLQSPYYDTSALASFTGIDLSPSMLAEARVKWGGVRGHDGLHPKLLEMDASRLSFPDASFDSVIDTFSFCTFDEPAKALHEMTRVLRPGGRVVLLENSLSTNPLLAGLQDLTEPIITPLSKNCRWNVNIPELAAAEPELQLVSAKDEQLGTITLRSYVKRSLK